MVIVIRTTPTPTEMIDGGMTVATTESALFPLEVDGIHLQDMAMLGHLHEIKEQLVELMVNLRSYPWTKVSSA